MVSDRFMENGSFLKFKTVTLSYRVPNGKIPFLKNLQVCATGQNLLTFTKYTGYDPDVSHRGVTNLEVGGEYSGYPQSRTFLPGDRRKVVTFKTDFLSPKTGKIVVSSIPLFGKYWQEGVTATGNCSINMHIMRYADALLMYAEALVETGKTDESMAVLNRVRERAFGDKTHNVTGLGKDALRDKIYLERRLELANEGQRWFDLVRTGRFVETMKAHGEKEAQLAEKNKTTITANAKDYQVLFPIPQVELDINPELSQNPGWKIYQKIRHPDLYFLKSARFQ